MGKAKLLDRRMMRPSVRRCLFGHPLDSDGFLELQKRIEEEEAERFKRRWDLHGGEENQIEWSRVDDSSIPEFYLRGYESSRTKPIFNCVGKKLSFDNDDMIDLTPTKPMQTSVEVFVFQSPMQEHSTPQSDTKSDSDDHEDSPQEKSDSSSASSTEEESAQTENVLRKKLKQRRLTDMYRVVKKRLGNESSSSDQKRRKLFSRV